MQSNPVVLCKFNKEILSYLSSKSVPIIYVEDQYDATTYHEEIENFELLGRYRVNDLNSVAELMSTASQIRIEFPDAKIVISPNEYSQYAAAIIRSVIDSDSNSMHLTVCTRDKALMKAVMHSHGVPVAQGFSLKGHDAKAAVRAATKRLSFPIVLKPRSAMSSQGVHKINSLVELQWHLGSMAPDVLDGYMCEEFIEAEEYFVDAIWSGGQAHLLLLGKYDTPMLNVAMGQSMVVSRYLSRENNRELYDSIVHMSYRTAAACGIKDGITHAEYFVTKDGRMYLGEVATRMGGGPHELMAKHATGHSLGELQARSLLGDLDTGPEESLQKGNTAIGYINLQPHKSGTVIRVLAEQRALALPGVVRVTKSVKPGDSFHLNGSSSWFFCCILEAKTDAELNTLIHKLSEMFFTELEMS